MKKIFLLFLLLIIRQSASAQGYWVEVCVNLTGPPLTGQITASLVYTANGVSDTSNVTIANVTPPYTFCFPAYLQIPDTSVFALANGYVSLSNCGPAQVVAYNQIIGGSTTINLSMQNCSSQGTCSASLNLIPGTTLLQASANASGPVTYSWDNGLTFSGNSIFQITAPGNYCVIIMDSTGCTASACYNYAGGSCTASIGISGSGPWTLSASGSGVQPLAYSWSNGLSSQTIVANSPGVYCLTITDATGCSDTSCITLNFPTQCGADIVELIDSTGAIYLEALPDSGTLITPTFLWTTGETTSIIYPSQPGQFCVQINYSSGCMASDCYSFNPGNPVGGCSLYAIAIPDSNNWGWVNFQSFPVGTPPFNYQWQFSNGTTSTLANPGINLSNNNGINWAYLTVTDATGCSSSYGLNVFIPYSNPNCNALFSLSANYQFGNPGEVFFTDLSNSPSSINFYAWSFGDGDSSTSANPSHTYSSAGYYNVCLTISNGSNCTATWCTSIYVDPAWWNSNPFQGPCTAGFLIFPGPSGIGMLNIVNTSQGNNLQYTWDFGNGTITNNPTPFVTYNSPGVYNICLSILDTLSGCNDIFCDSITVDSLGNVYRSPMSGNVGVRVSASPQPNSLLSIYTNENQSSFGFSLAPNPSNGDFVIQLFSPEEDNLRVEISDLSGRVVYQKNHSAFKGKSNIDINIEGLSNGTYLMKVGSNQYSGTERLVIQD